MQQTLCLFDLLNSRHGTINFVFGLDSLNCRLRLLYFFSESFSKKLFMFLFLFSCFSYLFNAPTRRFRTLSSASHVKYYLISQNFLPF